MHVGSMKCIIMWNNTLSVLGLCFTTWNQIKKSQDCKFSLIEWETQFVVKCVTYISELLSNILEIFCTNRNNNGHRSQTVMFSRENKYQAGVCHGLKFIKCLFQPSYITILFRASLVCLVAWWHFVQIRWYSSKY